MILFKDNVFYIETNDTSYVLRVDETKHLVNEYYGAKVSHELGILPLQSKWTTGLGSSIIYDEKLNKQESLDIIKSEFSLTGKGDYNSPSIILKNKDGYIFDFLFEKYEIKEIISHLENLPTPHNADQELIIYFLDSRTNITIELHYLVFEETNTIARNVIIQNNSNEDIEILKAASMQLVLNNDDFILTSLYGGWSGECKKEDTIIKHGTLTIDSKTGASSNRYNPFFMIKSKDASFNSGSVYAFNLIYSGNHCETIERTFIDQVRITVGLSSFCFNYCLKKNEKFETPYSVMTFANKGINGVSQNMHAFVNNHVVRGKYMNKERPVLINNWEATDFKFSESKLLKIAKTAKDCGIELFVLDDGWFGERNNDTAGLGDYDVNKKKLHHGLAGFAKKLNKLGLKFGLWFEPEMINEDSELYRKHPEFIVKHPGYFASTGRHQFCLDLTKVDVQEYIIENVCKTLSSANISYVKWDYNRHISDFYMEDGKSGEFFYRYIQGLYHILEKVTKANPDVLFEGCSSGGNRFDLGILSYFQQNWASDNTDAIERNYIQSGLYLGYPLSTIGAHVSACPSHSVLRNTPIDTRFNVAAFGDLGYELDLNHLSKVELKMVKKQISFYKKHRSLFQYGKFYQFSYLDSSNHSEWMVQSKDKSEAIYGYFNLLQKINPEETTIKGINFIDEEIYKVEVRKQEHLLTEFGSLINMVLPVRVNEKGLLIHEISKHKTMPAENEEYLVSGSMLNNNAIKLKPEWSGTGFDDSIRALEDFGSRLYFISLVKK